MSGPWTLMSVFVFALAVTGGVLVLRSLPPLNPVRLSERLAPHVRGIEKGVRVEVRRGVVLGAAHEKAGLVEGFRSLVLGSLSRLFPSQGSLKRRLEHLGTQLTPEQFRWQQIVWALCGLLGSAGAIAVIAQFRHVSPLMAVLFSSGWCAGGFIGRDWYLGQQISRRQERIFHEFPTVAELLAIAVGAGESITAALDRIGSASDAEVAKIFRRAVSLHRSGMPLVEALWTVSRSCGVSSIERFFDAVIVAVERGTPLAEILRAQSQDAREQAKRELIESAGKKEIYMMMPVVFGILPLTVLFAVFPGVSLLNVGF